MSPNTSFHGSMNVRFCFDIQQLAEKNSGNVYVKHSTQDYHVLDHVHCGEFLRLFHVSECIGHKSSSSCVLYTPRFDL